MGDSVNPTLAIGAPAPSLQLKTTEGHIVDVTKFLGYPVLVTFLSHAA
jgi:peroxiredoxin